MKIIHQNEIREMERNVSCIGYFDGVHLGHQKLIEETVKLAKKKKLIPCAITFYPDPETIVRKNEVFELTDLNRRLELLEQYGISNVLLLDFDEKLMKMNSEEFIDEFIIAANVDTLICGFDFRFGYKASGTVDDLRNRKEFSLCEIPEIRYDGEKISSTRIRNLIKENRIEEARELLGHE